MLYLEPMLIGCPGEGMNRNVDIILGPFLTFRLRSLSQVLRQRLIEIDVNLQICSLTNVKTRKQGAAFVRARPVAPISQTCDCMVDATKCRQHQCQSKL